MNDEQTPVCRVYTLVASVQPRRSAEVMQLLAQVMSEYCDMSERECHAVAAWFSGVYGQDRSRP